MKSNTFNFAIFILSTFFLFSTTAMAQQVAQPDIRNGDIAGVWQTYDENAGLTTLNFSPYDNLFEATTEVWGTTWGDYKVENSTLIMNMWGNDTPLTDTFENFLAIYTYVGPSTGVVVPQNSRPTSTTSTTSTTSRTPQVEKPDLSKGKIAGVWESYDEAGNKTVIDFSPHFYFKVTTDTGGSDMGEWKIENGIITLNFWTMTHTMSGPVEEFFASAAYTGPTQHIEVPAGMSMDAFNNTINMQMNRTQQMHMNTMEMLDDMSGSDDYDYYMEDDNGNTYGRDW